MDEQISYLVLHTRLAMLRNSLAMVCNAIDQLERVRNPALREPRAEPPVQRLSRAVGDAESRLRALVQSIPNIDSQRKATEVLNALATARLDAVSAAEVPQRTLFALHNTSVGVDLSGYASDLLSDIEEIEAEVDTAVGKPDAEAAELMADAWMVTAKPWLAVTSSSPSTSISSGGPATRCRARSGPLPDRRRPDQHLAFCWYSLVVAFNSGRGSAGEYVHCAIDPSRVP